MSEPILVGDTVRALITMEDCLSDHGLGTVVCARAGELLVVRSIDSDGKAMQLSHAHLHDKTFRAYAGEVEKVSI